MTRRIAPLLFVLPLLAGTVLAADDHRILVVDLQRVVETCDEATDLIAALNKEKTEKQRQLEDEIDKLKQREKELLDIHMSDRDPGWYDKIRQVQKEANEIKADQAYFLALANDRIARKLNALMRGAQMEARKIMRDRGASIVLISKTGEIRLETDQQLKDELINRRVLCLADEADITDEVLKRMNEWYANNKTSTGDVPDREEPAKKDDKKSD